MEIAHRMPSGRAAIRGVGRRGRGRVVSGRRGISSGFRRRRGRRGFRRLRRFVSRRGLRRRVGSRGLLWLVGRRGFRVSGPHRGRTVGDLPWRGWWRFGRLRRSSTALLSAGFRGPDGRRSRLGRVLPPGADVRRTRRPVRRSPRLRRGRGDSRAWRRRWGGGRAWRWGWGDSRAWRRG